MNVGIVFASTGGEKVVRAVRSLRRTEPDLPIHVVLDVSSRTWKTEGNKVFDALRQQPGIKTRLFENKFYINGNLNEGMRWMRELGYNRVCLFHDDLIFTPFKEHLYHLSLWFDRIESDEQLKEAAGVNLSALETFVPNYPVTTFVPGIEGKWERHPQEWDSMDLESEEIWKMLYPLELPVGYCKDVHKVCLPTGSFYFMYVGTHGAVDRTARLGPTGQIVPVSKWEAIGGFDEEYGIFYDLEYAGACAIKNLGPVLQIPSVPHLHLHNQSMGYADPAVGMWSNTTASFEKKYGETIGSFWKRYP